MKKMSGLARLVYSLVGISSIFAIYFLFSDWSNFWSTMSLAGSIPFILLTIGGLNWGIVAITGNKKMDLFGLLNL